MAAGWFRAFRLVSKEMSLLLKEADRQALRKRLFTLYQSTFSIIALSDDHLLQMVEDSLDEERSAALINIASKAIGRDLKGLRTLEIGAGVGLGVVVARGRFSADAFGIEPGTDEYGGTLDVAHDILARCGMPKEAVVGGVGEDLPFPDASFDLVISSNVLEHVDNPQKVIDESVRVLKPGGHIVIVVPNYGSWWEGHYGVLWLPHMPLWMAKIYIRLLGRDPSYLDTLNFVSAGHMRKWLKPHRTQIEVLDWGADLFSHRMGTLDFAEYGALARLKKVVQIFHKLGIVRLVTRICIMFNWQTPIVLTARRRTAKV